MKNIFLVSIITFISFLQSYAQQNEADFLNNNAIAKIPELQTKTVSQIAAYINKNYASSADKAQAIYYFCTHQISYDVNNEYNDGAVLQSPVDFAQLALKKKSGICEHYAQLFKALSLACNIECMVIQGLCKTPGNTSLMAHSWNIIKLNNQYQMVDATWGAGYVSANTFTKNFDSKWYLMPAQKFMETHDPYDYLWQLNNNIVSHEQFINNNNQGFLISDFAYSDSIASFIQKDTLQQFQAELMRIVNNPCKDVFVNNRILLLQNNIEIIKVNNQIAFFNKGSRDFNIAVEKYNNYIESRNKKFAGRTESSLIISLTEVETNLNNAYLNLSNIESSNSLNAAKQALQSNISELQKNISQEKLYVNTFFNK